jgi:hypothetical protein
VGHRVDVTHHIPGRMRIKVPKAKGNLKLLEELQKSVSTMPGVSSAEINSVTGSILLHYDEARHESFEDEICKHGDANKLFSVGPPELTEADEIASKIESEAEFLSEHSDTARSVVNFFKYLNETVKRATGNSLDLKVLLPLGLAIYVVTTEEPMTSTPMWVTLAIFSFNSFVGLHRPTHQEKPVHKVVMDDPGTSKSGRQVASGGQPSK